MQIRLGHSPDPDDAFMFWGLASGEVDPRRFEFEHVLRDIQTLNEWALKGELEVTAISLAAYPLVQERYVLLPHGASMGSGYGPIVVARDELSTADLRGLEIAVPGELTTAFLVLRMCLGGFRYREVPFDRIIEEVQSGRSDAGLLIHEGQLTYEAEGLKKVVDLGEWWLLETGLPLPLGANVARRDVGAENLFELSDVLRDSIQAGLDNREEAMEHALQYGRGLDTRAGRPLRRHVRERAHLRLRRRRSPGGARATRAGGGAGDVRPAGSRRVRRLSREARWPARAARRCCSNSWTAAHMAERLVAEHMERAGVSDEQFALLSRIALDGPVTPTALAAEMGVPPTTLADAVRRLDERGEIERLPNPADGRSHLLTLSPAGRKRVEAAAPAVWSALEEMRGHLGVPSEEVEAALDELHRSLRAATAQTPERN